MKRRITLISLLSLSILVPLMGQTCATVVPLTLPPDPNNPAAQPIPGAQGPEATSSITAMATSVSGPICPMRGCMSPTDPLVTTS